MLTSNLRKSLINEARSFIADPTPLVVTSGEPAGVGPDIVLSLLKKNLSYPIEILGDVRVFQERSALLGLEKEFYRALSAQGKVRFRDIPCAAPVEPGKLNTSNAPYVLKLVETALEGIEEKRYKVLVTGPVHKGVINKAGIPFTGHTEFLQQAAGVKRVIMMFKAPNLAVALATTHLPLKKIPTAINRNLLEEIIPLLAIELKNKFKIERARIAVTGFNPHAGEGGYLGSEEENIIKPAIRTCQDQGFLVEGPFSADTVFQKKIIEDHDIVLGMYHDQVLPVIKYAGFFEAVNVTLGLPYVRVSVDHGSALELAGTGKASPQSLLAALSLAATLE